MSETTIRNETLAVGTTAVSVSLPKERKTIYIKNTSSGAAAAAIITVCFSNVQIAVANAGYVLDPRNYITDSDSESYAAWDGAITAISDTAASQLTIVERI
jgi:hypothetical protein